MNETLQANPEQYENELVAGFSEMADMAAEVAQREMAASANPNHVQADAERFSAGFSAADAVELVQRNHPGISTEDATVQGARLFNRMVIEAHDLPEPDDMSRMDTTSSTARMGSMDVLAYAVGHAGDHMANDGTLAEKLAAMKDAKLDKLIEARGGGSEEYRADLREYLDDTAKNHGHIKLSRKYPNMADYI